MFDLEHSSAQYGANPIRFTLELQWPIGIVFDKSDLSGKRHELPDRDRAELLLRR